MKFLQIGTGFIGDFSSRAEMLTNFETIAEQVSFDGPSTFTTTASPFTTAAMDTATTTASYRTDAGTNYCLYFDPEI
jgi:hypothetical protein